MTTYWTNWPLVNRQSPPGGPAAEMNERFFDDFHRRDEHGKTRICQGDNLSGQVTVPTVGVWTAVAGSSTIWIPPWAEFLVARFSAALRYTGGSTMNGVGLIRPKVGAVYGSIVTLTVPWQSGGPDESLYDVESLVYVGGMQDTEQTLIYEVRRDSVDVDYVRVFNDAKDATDGHRHRHWYFLSGTTVGS